MKTNCVTSPQKADELEAAFQKRIRRLDGHWFWIGQTTSRCSYPILVIKHQGKRTTYFAHKLAFSLYVRPVPTDVDVLRKCPFRNCVNPQHLDLGQTPDEAYMGRFWSKVEKTETCWLWKGSKFTNGYGQFSYRNKNLKAHRVAYEISKGEIAEGLFVCHHCDNPSCVNPDHLFLGTCLDNARDKMEKNRGCTGDRNGTRTKPNTRPRGENVSTAKLTKEQVKQMRELYSKGNIGHRKIAQMFGITRSSAHAILKGKHWKHV